MSGMFKSKKTTPEYVSTPADSRIEEVYKSLQPYLSDSSKALGSTYDGTLVAPLTSQEQTILGKFNQYLADPNAAMSPELTAATKEIQRIYGTGAGSYDPFQAGGAADYIQGRLNKYLKETALPEVERTGAFSGNYFGSSQMNRKAKVVSDTTDKLASYLYDMQSNLQNLRANNLGMALNIGTARTTEPVNRLMAELNLGGYQRTQYDQPLATATYNDWKSTSDVAKLMASLAGQQGGALAYPSYQPSVFDKYVWPTIQNGIYAMQGGNFMGGGTGGSSAGGLSTLGMGSSGGGGGAMYGGTSYSLASSPMVAAL